MLLVILLALAAGQQLADGDLTFQTGAVVVTASTGGTANAINGLTISVKDSTGNVRTAATNALSSFSETTSATNKRARRKCNFPNWSKYWSKLNSRY